MESLALLGTDAKPVFMGDWDHRAYDRAPSFPAAFCLMAP